MARTKASVGAKVASGKSTKARCSAAPPSSSNGSSGGSDKGSKNTSGGNPVCPRETPKWQKPITSFFIGKETTQEATDDEIEVAGSSKPNARRNRIRSEESNDGFEKPENKELDDTLELQPLSGEKSHKIEEYYSEKGKGKGKKSGKENKESERRSLKRDRHEEDVSANEIAVKKVKICDEIIV